MARRVAITRKVSLAEFADGWDDCYAIVTLADYDEVKTISGMNFKKMKNIDAVGFEIETVMKHFVSGKINVIDETSNEPQLVDMEADDIKASPKLSDYLYTVVMGVTLDPKDIATAALNNPEPTTDSNSTKTTSSTESPVA